MEINPKFELGQEVFYFKDSKVKSSLIRSITITLFRDEIKVSHPEGKKEMVGSGEYETSIKYEYNVEGHSFNKFENEIFTSKEELINSL